MVKIQFKHRHDKRSSQLYVSIILLTRYKITLFAKDPPLQIQKWVQKGQTVTNKMSDNSANWLL